MSQPTTTAAEFGAFDTASLPIDWSKVDPEKVKAAQELLESNMDEQVAQLNEMVKQNESQTSSSKDGSEIGSASNDDKPTEHIAP